MERLELNLKLIACLLFFNLFSQSTNAAVTTNQAIANIDWGSLSLNFIFGGVASTENEETGVSVELEDELGSLDTDFASISDWSTAIDANINYSDANFTTAISSANGSATELSSSSELVSSVGSIITGGSYREATITATGTNILLLTASYSLLAEVTDSLLYEAYSVLGFSVTVENSGVAKNFDASANVYTDVGGGESSSQDSGILALAIPVEAGDVLNFSAFTYTEVISNNSPVPLPPAMWMFITALAALVTIRKS